MGVKGVEGGRGYREGKGKGRKKGGRFIRKINYAEKKKKMWKKKKKNSNRDMPWSSILPWIDDKMITIRTMSLPITIYRAITCWCKIDPFWFISHNKYFHYLLESFRTGSY